MSTNGSWTWVDEPGLLEEMVRELDRSEQVAVDTESDSMFCYFEKVCLLQIANEERAWLVDPLALKGQLGCMEEVFGNPRILKVLHGADYDVVCLKRDYGFQIENIFDTMIAAQHLGVQKIGLADLVEESFGDRLEKKHTRTNWAKRPLSESELLYSYLDVKYLLELARRLDRRLHEEDVREEAALEFARLEEREPASREFDSDGYMRLKGTQDLSDVELAVLRELFIMRDRRSRRIDRPPFKVLANDTMMRISRARPRAADALGSIRGVTPYVSRNLGSQILKAVAQGIGRGRPPKPRKRKPRNPRLSPRRQRQMEALKAWRKVRAAGRGVPTLVVLPNHAVMEIVIEAPADIASLGALGTVGSKRAGLYGVEILEILTDRG